MEERDWREYEKRVVDAVKWCEERNEGPLVWSTVVGRLATAVPSPELGQVLVSHLCFDHNRPPLWKFIEKSLSTGLLFPIHVLSLLFARVIPNRSSQPKAYTVYLELLSRYALSFESLPQDVSKEKIIEDIDGALKLSQLYDVNIRTLELGHTFVLFLFRVIEGLIDVVLDDWGLVKKSSDRSRLAFGTTDHTDMDVDSNENHNLEKKVYVVEMRITNTLKAMEVLGKLTESKKAVLLLRLVHINMPVNFDSLHSKLQLLKAYWLSSSDLKPGTQLFAEFYGNIQRVVGFQRQLDKRHLMGMLIENGLRKPFSLCNFRYDFSACWIGFDLYLENALDGKQLPIKAVVDVLAEAIRTLQIINQATWQETFLALWLAALRLVQRERDPLEGPIPHLETRLCILLSVVPLSIAKLLNMEMQLNSNLPVTTLSGQETGYGHNISGKARFPRKHGLVLALQVLGQFSSLVCPPESVVDAADSAATKAARFIRSSTNEDHGADFDRYDQGSVKAGGNMIHLVVEACIARNLIDTSAYFWPDYVPALPFSPSDKTPVKSPWLVFLEGAPLSGHLVNSLVSIPAPSLVEVEKLYNIALNGSEEEKPVAAKILCGASLKSGWNIQEHVVRFVVKLLSPPAPPNYSESRSHLVDYMPMLSVILYRASSVDMVHILSLHGAVPEVAASLMPLCEVFGSLEPAIHNKSTKRDEPSIYMVYSLAFLFLLRLWKFYRPPIEQCITEYARINGVELNLEYLLVLHNSRSIFLNGEINSDKAVYVDSFPKLRSWYLQNKSCVSSPLSGLSTEKPAYQVANAILNMIYSKVTTSGTTSSLSSGSSSPINMGEDVFHQTLHFPAWQVLEAMPFVLDALLAACSYQRISSRNMITGLRDLVDYLPATLAVIISYFSAEVTRGIWKPVPMNGIEWPSPAPVLQQVESEIKAILSASGVDMPSCLPSFSSDGPEITLPLPMAVLVSLTITFKLDKNLEYIHAVAGPALENCASGCPWPGMAVVSCLWAQKVRRWHDFIVVSSSRSVFRHSKKAVGQLLRSCFSAYLGPVVQSPAATSPLSKNRGVDGLLGHVISSSVSPGFLYLRSCRTIQNVVLYVNDAIVNLVAEYARASLTPMGSLGLTTARLREAAALGSSLICISGGYRLVQELYTQTIPTWLLSPSNSGGGGAMEGYAVACLAFQSGCLMWGLQEKLPKCIQIKRLRILGVHVNFLGQMLEGKAVGSNMAVWKAYVCCFVGQMVRFAPGWIPDLRQETLMAVATGLKGWQEYELALSLLEKGGIQAMGPAAELANIIGAGGSNR